VLRENEEFGFYAPRAQTSRFATRFQQRLFLGIAKRGFYGVFSNVLNFFRWYNTKETVFFLGFGKARSRFLGKYAVFWAEFFPIGP
jgi:hypothetical protein